MPSLIRNQLFIAVLALSSACLAVVCAARLFGELSAFQPIKSMQLWANDGRMGSHSQRQALLSRLLMSLHVSPWSADRHMDLARFYTWHMHGLPRQSSQHQIYAQRTQQQILEAVRRRPSWGFAWAALAENSVVAGQYDPAVNNFIEQALRYGSFEPGTLRKVSLLGMIHWKEFPQPLRHKILMAVTQALKIDSHPTSLIRLAFSLQWQDQLWPLLQTPAQRAEFARQTKRLKV